MNTTEKNDNNPPAPLELLLAEAGLSFTHVDRCPQPSCEVCDPVALNAAAA